MQTQSLLHKQPILSPTHNERLSAIQGPGRYWGYDVLVPSSSTKFRLDHVKNPHRKNGSILSGVALSPQGTIITEVGTVGQYGSDDPLNDFVVSSNISGLTRIDIIVMSHVYSPTGNNVPNPAIYSIIEGTPSATPTPPSVFNPISQTIIGYIELKNGYSLFTPSTYEFTPASEMGPGGFAYAKLDYTNHFKAANYQSPKTTILTTNNLQLVGEGNVFRISTVAEIRTITAKPEGTIIYLIGKIKIGNALTVPIGNYPIVQQGTTTALQTAWTNKESVIALMSYQNSWLEISRGATPEVLDTFFSSIFTNTNEILAMQAPKNPWLDVNTTVGYAPNFGGYSGSLSPRQLSYRMNNTGEIVIDGAFSSIAGLTVPDLVCVFPIVLSKECIFSGTDFGLYSTNVPAKFKIDTAGRLFVIEGADPGVSIAELYICNQLIPLD